MDALLGGPRLLFSLRNTNGQGCWISILSLQKAKSCVFPPGGAPDTNASVSLLSTYCVPLDSREASEPRYRTLAFGPGCWRPGEGSERSFSAEGRPRQSGRGAALRRKGTGAQAFTSGLWLSKPERGEHSRLRRCLRKHMHGLCWETPVLEPAGTQARVSAG